MIIVTRFKRVGIPSKVFDPANHVNPLLQEGLTSLTRA